MTKNPVDGFSVGLKDDDNIYVWQIMMEGQPVRHTRNRPNTRARDCRAALHVRDDEATQCGGARADG